jgi:hypothetical protein
MKETPSPPKVFLSRIGEDWWAVIVGLTLIALVVLGILGPIPW